MNALKKIGLHSILFSALLIAGCNKENKDFEANYQYDYFPVDSGHYVIYDVDSISFDDNFTPSRADTNEYQVKEVIESTFIDNEGRTAYRLERFTRKDSTQPWQIRNAWYLVRNQTSAERVEENLRFVKLVFPPEVGETWMGNQYITITPEISYYEGWEYEISEVNVPYSVNGLAFEETLKVMQVDEENLIEKVFAEERYARGVGLIEREFQKLEKQNVSAPWSQPESGFIIRMKVWDYKR